MPICPDLLSSNKMYCLPETPHSSLGTRKEKERMLSFGIAKNFNMRLGGGKTKGGKKKLKLKKKLNLRHRY